LRQAVERLAQILGRERDQERENQHRQGRAHTINRRKQEARTLFQRQWMSVGAQNQPVIGA
jgi:hypothetical protein